MADELNQDLRAAPLRAQLERLEKPVPAEDAPQVDAWLERRLRVFERALAQLEARHEKTEQDLRRKLALLEEMVAARQIESAVPSLAVEPEVVETSGPEHAPQAAPVPYNVTADPDLAAVQKDMRAFIAEARKLAKTNIAAAPTRRKNAPRWIAWSAAGCASALVVTALVLGTVAGASVPPAGGVSHRQLAVGTLARVIAQADSGDARAETMLAVAYLHGEHVAPDHGAAVRWALAAAGRGDPVAQYLVGTFYRSGDGVTADARAAFGWFEAAALRGNLKAMHNLAIAYAQGLGTVADAERAAAWFNRAACQGYTDSQFDLAVLYERGDGVKQNPLAALKWYLVAARAGDKEADARAGQLAAEMPTADVALAQSRAMDYAPMSADQAANRL
jgi:localization factor PodJL